MFVGGGSVVVGGGDVGMVLGNILQFYRKLPGVVGDARGLQITKMILRSCIHIYRRPSSDRSCAQTSQ